MDWILFKRRLRPTATVAVEALRVTAAQR